MVVVSFAVAYGLAALVSIAVFRRALRARPRRGAGTLAVIMGGCTWWSAMKLAEALVFEHVQVRLIFTALHWIGVGVVSVGVFAFGLALVGRENWLTPPRIAALVILPGFPVLAWLGDPRVISFLTLYADLPPIAASVLREVESTWSWLRWLALAYLWGLVVLGSIFIVKTALERPKPDQNRLLLGVMVAVPLVINLLYEAGVIPYTGFDPTVLGFVVTGVVGVAAIDRFRLFDVPFARSQIVEEFDTPLLVYGRDDGLYDYNRSAADLLGVTPDDIDRDILEVLSETPIPVSEWTGTEPSDVTALLSGKRVSLSAGDGGDRQFLLQTSRLGDETVPELGYTVQLTDITERYRQHERIRRERDLTEIIRNILVQLSGRGEIEQAVCDRLANEDRYSFVWIGERSGSDSLRPGAFSDGDRGGGASRGGDHPLIDGSRDTALEALQTGKHTIETDLDGSEDGRSGPAIEAVAAFPLVNDDLTYGVLVVCASRAGAFDREEERLLTDLSESIAAAIDAVEQRQALQGETVREAVLRVSDPAHYLGALATSDVMQNAEARADVYEVGSDISATTTSPHGGAERTGVLHFLTVSGAPEETVAEVVADHPEVRSATTLSNEEGTASLRLLVQSPTLGSLVADHGGSIRTSRVGDGAVEVVVEVPPRTEVSRMMDAIRRRYPDATMTSLVTKEPSAIRTAPEPLESLTAKQREALEAAYRSGFFERPQGNTAEEISTALGVSRSTFLEHLRTAEDKVLAALLSDSE